MSEPPAAADDRQLLDLLDEARAAEAARGRARRRWLRQQAAEGATLAGVLVDLAERGAPVVVRTVTGRTWSGPLLTVGVDVVVLRCPAGVVYLATAGVAWVRPGDGAASPGCGDRAPADVALTELLAAAAAERAEVWLATTGDDQVRGVLLGAGVDVLTLRSEGDGTCCYVPAQSVSELVALASG